MSNPYRPPFKATRENEEDVSQFGSTIGRPAIALLVVSGFAIVFGLFALAADVMILKSGMVGTVEGYVSGHSTILIRVVWGVVLLFASSYVFYGALAMKSMTDYEIAKSAAIVAMVPLLGPCCFVGIPFGIWAYATLNNPEV